MADPIPPETGPASLASLRAEIDRLNDEVLMGSLSASGALHAWALRLLALAEAAEPTIRETGHLRPCTGCTCGASDRFKDLRNEFYRRWRAVSARPGAAGEE